MQSNLQLHSSRFITGMHQGIYNHNSTVCTEESATEWGSFCLFKDASYFLRVGFGGWKGLMLLLLYSLFFLNDKWV